VDADDARDVALRDDTRWRRLVTDPVAGHLVARSGSAHRIPDPMKAAVRARNRVRRFPGCATQAKHTDTHHVAPSPRGRTDPTDLAPGCHGHHRVKTHSGWRCETRPDGSILRTGPLGTRHITYPWNCADPGY
jgi:hypothetical protein